MNTIPKHQYGFTLIELMLPKAIFGILAAIMIPAYDSYIHNVQMQRVTDHMDTTQRIYL